MTVATNDAENATTISAPIDRAWASVASAFDSLAIPITSREAATYVMANSGFKVRRQIGGVALSKYIDCGESQIGPNADSYDVYMTVQTQLRAESSGTIVATTLDIMAKPVTYSQGYSRCSSNGKLEARIAKLVQTSASASLNGNY